MSAATEHGYVEFRVVMLDRYVIAAGPEREAWLGAYVVSSESFGRVERSSSDRQVFVGRARSEVVAMLTALARGEIDAFDQIARRVDPAYPLP